MHCGGAARKAHSQKWLCHKEEWRDKLAATTAAGAGNQRARFGKRALQRRATPRYGAQPEMAVPQSAQPGVAVLRRRLVGAEGLDYVDAGGSGCR